MGNNISAILLAAGLSSRMGMPKLLLPWGGTTVLGQVVSTFAGAGLEEIVVVTGGAHEQIERLAVELANDYPVRTVYNPEYARGEMLSSIQTGLSVMDSQDRAALIGLGDQPQVREETVRHICDAFIRTRSPLVIPSFRESARSSLAGGEFDLAGNPVAVHLHNPAPVPECLYRSGGIYRCG